MPEAVIVDSVRTPVGRAFKGSLAQLRPDETGAFVIDQLLERNADVAPDVDHLAFTGFGELCNLGGLDLEPRLGHILDDAFDWSFVHRSELSIPAPGTKLVVVPLPVGSPPSL